VTHDSLRYMNVLTYLLTYLMIGCEAVTKYRNSIRKRRFCSQVCLTVCTFDINNQSKLQRTKIKVKVLVNGSLLRASTAGYITLKASRLWVLSRDLLASLVYNVYLHGLSVNTKTMPGESAVFSRVEGRCFSLHSLWSVNTTNYRRTAFRCDVSAGSNVVNTSRCMISW